MKITEVHTHISVQFGHRKREERHFSCVGKKPKISNLTFELIPNVGIRATNPEDSVVIPFVNITAFRTEPEESKVVEPTKEEREVLGFDEDESEE